jgi:LCP family protein required for cell wall assembly
VTHATERAGRHRAPRAGLLPARTLRSRVALVAGALALLLVGACGSLAMYYNGRLGDVDRITSLGDAASRPERQSEALNILLMGTDNGNGTSIKEELADGEWESGSHRSDTLMILHITADRDAAYLVSIPRDSYVPIPGHGRDKVNAAFSYGGPLLAQRTVEGLTDVRMDHLVMIDWASFKDLTTALGGVPITIPETFTDPKTDRTWEEGTHHLQGQEALAYVRTRYGLENGDFDRIKRQQNFLRALLRKTLSQGTVSNPVRLTNVLEVLTDNLTVDASFGVGEMRDLALSLRSLRGDDVEYLTAPLGRYDEVGGQSVVRLKPGESQALFETLRRDDIRSYLRRFGGERLPGADAVR